MPSDSSDVTWYFVDSDGDIVEEVDDITELLDDRGGVKDGGKVTDQRPD